MATYRQWLQRKADAGDSSAAYALKFQGDDGGINGNWVVAENNARENPDQEYSRFIINRGSQMRGLHSQYKAAQSGGGDDDDSWSGGSGSGGGDVDEDAAVRRQLREQIMNLGDDVDSVYGSLFGDLKKLIRARDAELEEQYGGQLAKATEQYADAIPDIETSYAAIGAENSTDTSDAKTGAKKGFDETTQTIGKNKQADKAKLGQYSKEQEAKFKTDQENARRNIARADDTKDVGALRQMRNDLETNIDTSKVTRATLGTDGSARKELSSLTSDNGRYEAAIGALDSILKSSMSGAVKQAAVQAVTDSAGLSDEEKKKVQETYGNVYAEQAAL